MPKTSTSGNDAKNLRALLTTGDVCRILQISKGGVYQMVQRAELPGLLKIGRRLRFRAEEIEKWLAECEIKQPCRN